MPNKLLSILIPTYNRADFLDYSLSVHVPLVREYNVQIFIFDNASTDNTEEIVQKWQKEYAYLVYYRHIDNIGGIGNFEFSLQYPSTEYVWMLGDTYQIPFQTMEIVLQILMQPDTKFNAIVLNLDGKLNNISRVYQDKNILLNELGALITCIAVSIFRKDMISEDILVRYRDLWFTHMAIICEYISTKNFQVKWLKEYSISSLSNPKLKKINWSNTPKAFEIGCEDWTNFVMSLPPSYKLENKMKCIMDFGKISGLFTFRNLILLRMKGLLDTTVFHQYKKLFPLTIDYPKFFILLLSIIPKQVLIIGSILLILLLKKNKKNKIKQLIKGNI